MNADGTITNYDCDMNVPTMPCPTPYKGSITAITRYLETERPGGWMGEIEKLQDMTGAVVKSKTDWPVKFRLISPETVLPRQVSHNR